MAEMLIQSESLVSIADEVRELSDTTDKMSLSAMTSNLQEANADVNTEADLIAQIQSALEGKAGGGGSVDYSVEDGLITRTLSGTYENSRVTNVGKEAFAYCSNLTSANFPACTYIDTYAFLRCSKLTTANFPTCTSIGQGVFSSCTSLELLNFPVCSIISGSAFNGCSSLTSVSFPVCTRIDNYAFVNCTSLISMSFPICTYINRNAFSGCSKLTTANFPSCKTIVDSAFYNCSSLISISLPVCNYISANAFNNCRVLSSLTLGSHTVLCTLVNSNAFTSTPYAGYSTYFSGTPYIYVPGSLISFYQTATNWTYFSSYFSAIPGTEVGGGTENLITFTIGGTSYQAEDGMTWAEWVGSTYNTDGYKLDNWGGDNLFVVTSDDMSCVYDEADSIEVYSTDIIMNNYAYTLY